MMCLPKFDPIVDPPTQAQEVLSQAVSKALFVQAANDIQNQEVDESNVNKCLMITFSQAFSAHCDFNDLLDIYQQLYPSHDEHQVRKQCYTTVREGKKKSGLECEKLEWPLKPRVCTNVNVVH